MNRRNFGRRLLALFGAAFVKPSAIEAAPALLPMQVLQRLDDCHAHLHGREDVIHVFSQSYDRLGVSLMESGDHFDIGTLLQVGADGRVERQREGRLIGVSMTSGVHPGDTVAVSWV